MKTVQEQNREMLEIIIAALNSGSLLITSVDMQETSVDTMLPPNGLCIVIKSVRVKEAGK